MAINNPYALRIPPTGRILARLGEWLSPFNQSFSVQATFYSHSAVSSNIVGVTGDGTGGGSQWNMPFFSIASDGTLYGWVYSETDLRGKLSYHVGHNKWVTATLTYSYDGGVDLFIDGVKVAEYRGNVPFQSLAKSNLSTAYMGNYLIGVKPVGTGAWSSDISLDEVRFFDYKLSDAEVVDMVFKKIERSTPGLRNYFTFDEGTGNTVYNQVPGSAYNMTLTGTSWVEGMVDFFEGRTYFVKTKNGYKKYSAGVWELFSTTLPTQAEFESQGMRASNVKAIPTSAWKEIQVEDSDFKIIGFSLDNKVPNTKITLGNLYDSGDTSYHGTGIIKTEMEELQPQRKMLMVNADHIGCTFRYSLDNSTTWEPLALGEMMDISTKEGNQLVVEVNLPTGSAKLQAISYAWV